MKNVQVDKATFDAVLGKLLTSPPMPKATIARTRPIRKKVSKPSGGKGRASSPSR